MLWVEVDMLGGKEHDMMKGEQMKVVEQDNHYSVDPDVADAVGIVGGRGELG